MKIVVFLFIHIFFVNNLLGAEIKLTQDEKDFLQMHPVLKSPEIKFPPFNFKKDNVVQGFSVDYMNLLAQKLGVKIAYVSGYTWSEYIEMLQSGSIDLLGDISSSKERKKTLSFTDPYFTLYNIFYIKKGSQEYHSLADLNGKVLITLKDYKNANYIKKHYPLVKQLHVNSNLEAFQLLADGKGDVVIDTKSVANYLLKTNNISNVISSNIIDDRYLIDELRISVKKTNQLLLGLLKKAQKVISNKEINKLKEKWFDAPEIDEGLLLSLKEKQYLKNNTITYAGDPNWLPFEAFNSKGQYVGIISEHIDIIEQKLNLKFKMIITKNWLNTLELSKKMGADIISGDTADIVLAKNYKSIDTYIRNPLVIVTRDDYPFISDLNHLKDKKIAYIGGAGYVADIEKKYPNIDFIICDTQQDGLLGIKSGKYDIFIGTLSMIDYTIIHMGLEGIKISGDTGITMNRTLFVNKNKPLLHSIINKTMHSICDIQKHKIIAKWRQSKVNRTIIDFTLIWQIFALFLFLSLIGLLFVFILKNNNKKLHQILNITIESIVIFKNEKVINCNKVLVDMFGYDSLAEIKNKTVFDFIHPSQHQFLKKQLQESQKLYELLMLKKDGSTFPALIRGTLIGKNTRLTSIMDLTELRDTQEKLEILNRSLEDKVKKEVKKNKKQQLMLFQQNRLTQMGEMISMIAHQWRQPLNNLSILFQTVIINYQLNKLDDDIMEYFDHNSKNQLNQMSDTIDDFRNFFKPEKEKKTFDVSQSVHRAIGILSPILKKENITLHLSLPENCYTMGYSNELGQSLINILNNAKDALVENNISDKKIDISLCTNNLSIHLTISDNAGGIPENIIDKIFEPYFSTKNDKQGTGIGLYMSKMIIEEHMGGKIDILNKNDGATFKITLKRKQ